MSQRVAILSKPGAPILVQERPIPVIDSEHGILVKLTAAGVNHHNTPQRDSGTFGTEFPSVLGNDAVGIVEKVGPKVTRFEIGDRIVFECLSGMGMNGAFQEYALALSDFSAKIPSNVTDVQAATLPVAVSTSFTALFDPAGLDIPPPFNGRTVPPNSTIIVLGGSGSLGQAGIQFARLAGFDTIITTASKTHEEYLKGLGATHVLDRNATTDARAILEIAPGIDYVYDSISSAETNALSVAIVSRDGGTFVSSFPYRGADLPANITAKSIRGIFQKKFSNLGPLVYRALEGWLARGELKPNRTIVFEGLEKVDEALTFQGKGVSGHKIVIKIA